MLGKARSLKEGQDLKGAYQKYMEILKVDPSDAKAELALAGSSKKGNRHQDFLNQLKPLFERDDIHIDVKMTELIPYIQKVADTGDQELGAAVMELTDILEAKHSDQAKTFAAAADVAYYVDQKETRPPWKTSEDERVAKVVEARGVEP